MGIDAHRHGGASVPAELGYLGRRAPGGEQRARERMAERVDSDPRQLGGITGRMQTLVNNGAPMLRLAARAGKDPVLGRGRTSEFPAPQAGDELGTRMGIVRTPAAVLGL